MSTKTKPRKRQPKSSPQAFPHIAKSLWPLAVPIDSLILDPVNARTHGTKNLDAIQGSLAVYGQQKPVVVRQETMTVVAGNGQLLAARALGWTHLAANVVEMYAATAAGFAIADNRTAELSEWDTAALDSLLKGVATGLDERLDAMMADLAQTEGLYKAAVVEDEVPDPPKVATSKPGQLWLLGDHRLLCGDSTKAEDVGRVMGGERAQLCFTSPPYAQQRDYGAKITDWDGLMRGVFGNLPMADDGQVLVNLGLVHRDGEWWPYWDGWIEWMRSQGWRRFGWYVWDQGAGLPGDWNGRLAPSHEFLFHFNRQPVRPEKCVEKKPENVRASRGSTMRHADGTTKTFTNPEASAQPMKISDSVLRINRMRGNHGLEHPAVFPVALSAMAIEFWPGLAYEPFSGSGTTIIAAQQLSRRCFAIEIEPRYVDVAIERWEKLTGGKAVLDATP